MSEQQQPSSGVFEAVVDGLRASSWKGWSQRLKREREALDAPKSSRTARRVVVFRHAMGFHNDGGGLGTPFNRDALLNRTGRAQALLVGEQLTQDDFDWRRVRLVVSSPYRRAMETADLVLRGGTEIPPGTHETQVGTAHKTAAKIESFRAHVRSLEPFLAQPLAGEYIRNRTSKGDRATRRSELERWSPAVTSRFDLNELDRYCERNGVADGRWWHHGDFTASPSSSAKGAAPPRTGAPSNHGVETREMIAARAVEFRRWLGQTCADCGSFYDRGREGEEGMEQERGLTMVFSHGGLLLEAFGGQPYGNCEMRVFDIEANGDFTRVASVAEGEPLDSDQFEWLEEDSNKDDGVVSGEVATASKELGYVSPIGSAGAAALREYAHACSASAALALELAHDPLNIDTAVRLEKAHLEVQAAAAHLGEHRRPVSLDVHAVEIRTMLPIVRNESGSSATSSHRALLPLPASVAESGSSGAHGGAVNQPCRFGDRCQFVAKKQNSSRCSLCGTRFGVQRRTHCRGCGESLCLGKCLPDRAALVRISERCDGGHSKVCRRCSGNSTS